MDLTETEILSLLDSGQEAPRRQERLLLELRNVGTAASIPMLRGKVDATDVRVRVAALRALAVVEGAGALDCLIQALKHEDATTTKWAAQLMNQKVGLETEAVPDLIAVADERWETPSFPRAAVAKALAPLRDARAIPTFRRGVTAKGRRLREESAFGLALLGTPESQAALDDARRELSWLRAIAFRRGITAAGRRELEGAGPPGTDA